VKNLRLVVGLLLMIPAVALATSSTTPIERLDLTNHVVGYLSLIVFVLAYALVMAEEITHLRKSKPVILAAGIIWAMIALIYANHGIDHAAEQVARHTLLEFAELMLFLLVAMTYINSMEERGVFDMLRAWLIRKNYTFRQLFWITGILAFFISPIADNLTTALLMCAVVLAVGVSNKRFVSIAAINIVVASNAGGAFSPFGDITTLMVWQKGIVEFGEFFVLFIPSAVNFLVPAAIMHFAIPNEVPAKTSDEASFKLGARRIVFLFILTIITAVSFHNFLGLPPAMGMMTGLAYLQLSGYFIRRKEKKLMKESKSASAKSGDMALTEEPFDVFQNISRAEWDTLLFFYGVVMAVGGLGYIGYLELVSEGMYSEWGPTAANVTVGILSAVVDNIPVMFAVLTMLPDMDGGQWLLVTLTAGVGGSLLSIGSAAGVALMGQARGQYTFMSHLKWTPVIALGYAASILVHQWVNASLFDNIPVKMPG